MPATSGILMGYEYQSNGWVTSASGAVQTRFLADTDTCVFPDQIMIQGTKAAYQQAKGLNSSAAYEWFQRELSKFKASQAGADTLSLAPSTPSVLMTINNLPDSGFGQ
jgi:hypothetical protein